jgi:WD40 repeat protein/transcriptional regulator with XRE-family HTH domain
MKKRQPWYVILKRERMQKGWSQEDLAEKISSTEKTVSRWELGKTLMPGPYLRQKLAEVFEKSIVELGLFIDQEEAPNSVEIEAGDSVHALSGQAGWNEAPHIEHFVGRRQELDTITHWITVEHCHMVAVLGQGGIGKTSLATLLARQLEHDFSSVYWFSLQQATTIERFLEHYLQFVFQTRRTTLPENTDERISLMLASLRENPRLLVLDNFETVLSTGESAGRYRQGYEEYGRLLRLIGETEHSSCLLVTSREKTGEVASMEGKSSAVRTFQLGGLQQSAGRALLNDWNLYGSDETWENLVHLYTGNPLALKLVAAPIRELFGGNIANFLQEKELVFGDIAMLLERQFQRLGTPEREVMYWLTTEREPISVHELRTKMSKNATHRTLLDSVESLHRRSLVELRGEERLTLQPVVMEYVTRQFVGHIIQEVAQERLALLNSHALVQARAKDYVRISQEQFILRAIADELVTTFGKAELVNKLWNILDSLRKSQAERPGYAAGNILNLLIHLHADMRGANFSSLTVEQAYLQNVELIDVDFSHTHLATSVFTDTFSSILCVASSANGKLLAAGTTTGEVRLWQAETLTPLFICPGHADGVRSVAFSPDGKLLISGSEDFTLRIWNTNTGQCLRILNGHRGPVRSIAFSPDGWTIASASEDSTIRLWDAISGRSQAILEGHLGWVRSVAFNSDGTVLASGGDDTTIRLWDMRIGSAIAKLHGHHAAVRALSYCPGSGILASGSDDSTIRLWDVSSDEPAQQCRIIQGHTDLIRAIAFSSDGKLLASSSDDQTISLWDTDTGLVTKVLHPESNRIWSLAFFPDSSLLISASESASEDDTLRYWDVRQGQCIRKLRGYCSLIKSIAFSPDGQVLISGSEDTDLRVWNVVDGRCLNVLREHNNRIRSVAFSSDGRTVASGSEDETIYIWDIQSRLFRRELKGHSHLVRSVAFGPDSNIIASGSHDQTIRLWNIHTGQCLSVLTGPGGPVWSVAFSPDGSMIASGNEDGKVYLWDITTGTLITTLQGHTHRIWSVAFSSNGYTLASASDDTTLRTWDIRSGKCLHLFKGHKLWVRSVAFSPNGDVLASGSHDFTIRIWNAHTGKCLKTLEGHSSCVWSVAFNPAGRTIASCGDDGTIRLWDTISGACINILHSDRPYERMNISYAKGLTVAQKAALIALGAFEEGK